MAEASSRRYRKLVTPVSFTEKNDSKFAYARFIANINEGSVILLHVVPTQFYRLNRDFYRSEEGGGADPEFAEKVAREMLERTAAEKLSGVQTEIVIRHASNPAKTVLEVCDSMSADLLVVGKSELGELGARLQGGLHEKLIRGAKCPVWSVSAFDRFAQEEFVTSVLAPIEFDRTGLTVARAAGHMVAPHNGTVLLTHVILADPTYLEIHRADYGFSSDEPISLAGAQKGAQERLAAIAAEQLPGVRHEIVVTVAPDRPTGILEQERRQSPNLIVMMGPGDQSRFFQIVLGSDGETVARRAVCSVVTLRPPAGY